MAPGLEHPPASLQQEQNKSTRTCRRPAPSAPPNRGPGRGRAQSEPAQSAAVEQEQAQPRSCNLVLAARSLVSSAAAAAPGAWPV